jgi:hypothetical protein
VPIVQLYRVGTHGEGRPPPHTRLIVEPPRIRTLWLSRCAERFIIRQSFKHDLVLVTDVVAHCWCVLLEKCIKALGGKLLIVDREGDVHRTCSATFAIPRAEVLVFHVGNKRIDQGTIAIITEPTIIQLDHEPQVARLRSEIGFDCTHATFLQHPLTWNFELMSVAQIVHELMHAVYK